jgi:hypothetical protein
MLLTTTAEFFLSLRWVLAYTYQPLTNHLFRIWALSRGNNHIFYFTGLILAGQWLVILYIVSQSPKGVNEVAAVLPLLGPPLPPGTPLPILPDIDPYHSGYCL